MSNSFIIQVGDCFYGRDWQGDFFTQAINGAFLMTNQEAEKLHEKFNELLSPVKVSVIPFTLI